MKTGVRPMDSLDRQLARTRALQLVDRWIAGTPAPLRVCAHCSCTHEQPCPGGCWWVAPKICSNCVTLVHADFRDTRTNGAKP